MQATMSVPEVWRRQSEPARRDAAPQVRATGILVEDGAILLEHMVLRERSHWCLPGGRLDFGETLQECLKRELFEETGLGVEVGDLLYVCDRFRGLGSHVLDVSFEIRRASWSRAILRWDGAGDDAIDEVAMVPLEELPALGFSDKFVGLVRAGFPQRGSYQGDFHAFYG